MMSGFNYQNFKNALKREEERRLAELKEDISMVVAGIEKMLEKVFNTTACMASVQYPGIDF